MTPEYTAVRTESSDGREVAGGLGDRARAAEMQEIGHVPMCENPVLFPG